MTRRRDVNGSDSENEYEAGYRLAPLPSPTLDRQSPEVGVDADKNPFIQVHSEKSGPISYMNQFEVESLHDFIEAGVEEEAKVENDNDKVQYVSSLRSVEAIYMIGQQSSGLKSQQIQEENENEPVYSLKS